MMDHDDDHFDSIAALALGVLPTREAEPLAKHVSSCADCRLAYASMRAAADLVGYQEEALRIDEVAQFRLKSRVLKSIRATTDGEPAGDVPTNGTWPVPTARRAARPWLPWSLAAAAVIVAAVNTISTVSLREDNTRLETIATQQTNVAAASATQARELDRRIAAIVAPGSKHYAVPGGEIVAASGRMIIALHDLPALPAGKTYQAWTLKRGQKIMTPGATFGPDSAGIAFVDVPASAQGISAIAVSVEPASGSKAPTSKPTFVRTLT